ncbi:PH domain-like protein [Thozetella sp. PMI_491]|nr:PH domain-like protein [Thozetella sp. PMI_491]
MPALPARGRATPRKSRHRHQPSGSGPRAIAASDYESDAAHYMETREAPPVPPSLHRTNTELNISVLQRHLPDIQSILSQAANAVVYAFSADDQEWHKDGVEGTMFVCQQEPLLLPNGHAVPRACVFILNRRGLDNLAVDLMKVSHCEVAGELIILKLEDEHATDGAEVGAATKVLGLWVHADKDDTREINAAIIDSVWKRIKASIDALAESMAAAAAAAAAEGNLSEPAEADDSTASGSQAAGRRLSMTDLFGQKTANG